ncbi:MAG TPA: hypothetical protein VG076_08705 [Acidimicrobiales bacterium]|nr:hypothetical protein [Acidimicrobiales bacterium]
MSDHKNPIDQALDVFVFAPLGLLFSARETIPQLAEKGRQYVAAARVMGDFALGQGREQAEKVVRQASDQAGQTLSIVGGLTARRPSPPPPSPPPPRAPATAPATPPPPPPPPSPAPEAETVRAEASAEVGGNGQVPAPSVESLAIPGYDTLSASQVVQRLGGLSADELEAVRAYEESSRKRKTILARVQQLQTGS